MGTVAGAEPTAEVTGFTDGDTTQMCADTHHDEPFGLLDTVFVFLRVTENGNAVKENQNVSFLSPIASRSARRARG